MLADWKTQLRLSSALVKTYKCGDTVFKVAVDEMAALVTLPPDSSIVLQRDPARSGDSYGDGALTFSNKGLESRFTFDGATRNCRLAQSP